MIVVLVSIFVLIAAAAMAFVCFPLWRRSGRGRTILIASLAIFVLAIAAGAYVFVGHPELALRSLRNPNGRDVRGLVSALAWRMRNSPDDPRGWALLGRGYLSLNDPQDAASAFKRAAELAPRAQKPSLLSAYGEALTVMAMGTITPDAETAFRQALAGDPKDVAARFYLGQAYAQRRDTANALALWESLLADTSPDAPWRQALVDRIALEKGATMQAPPNIAEMVQRLADRLKTSPDDAPGWRRLVRAYVVLGELDKAHAALQDARKALVGDKADLAELDGEARELKLEN